MERINAINVLNDVSGAVHLLEGPNKIREFLRQVLRFQPVPLHSIARSTSLTVPVASALRRELEKRKLVARKGGIVLTEYGNSLLASVGVTKTQIPRLQSGYPFPSWLNPVVEKLDTLLSSRPTPDFSLDQSHAETPTIAMRVAYLYEHDGMEGKELLFLGDDDLTSLATIIFAKEFGLQLGTVAVVDVDKRILAFIAESCNYLGCDIDTFSLDLREGIPADLANTFDVFVTDPPYTLDGLSLFTARGIEALKPGVGKQCFLSYGSKSPSDSVKVYSSIVSMGLAIQDVIPQFNRYVGAQMYAGVSNMIRCITSENTVAKIPEDLYKLYTRSRNDPD